MPFVAEFLLSRMVTYALSWKSDNDNLNTEQVLMKKKEKKNNIEA